MSNASPIEVVQIPVDEIAAAIMKTMHFPAMPGGMRMVASDNQ